MRGHGRWAAESLLALDIREPRSELPVVGQILSPYPPLSYNPTADLITHILLRTPMPSRLAISLILLCPLQSSAEIKSWRIGDRSYLWQLALVSNRLI